MTKWSLRLLRLLVCVVLYTTGCASPVPILHSGLNPRYLYYQTTDDKVLMVEGTVEGDGSIYGSVYDISCLGLEWAERHRGEGLKGIEPCAQGEVRKIGEVQIDRSSYAYNWDMSAYDIIPGCRPLYGKWPVAVYPDWGERYSCANRWWEIPAGVLVIPLNIAAMPYVILHSLIAH